jgi:hypothetical protein
LGSFAVDFVTRQKLGGTSLTYFVVEQLAVLAPETFFAKEDFFTNSDLSAWIRRRIRELTYTAWDMSYLAGGLGDCDSTTRVNPPFIWCEERRFFLRAELDATFFHLYGIEREDVDYIMDTFPIVRRKDEATHGEYRTKRVILEMYYAMAEAIRTGMPYQTPISPPPGQGPRHPQQTTT